MGKARILSGGIGGLYEIRVEHEKKRLQAEKTRLIDAIAQISAQLPELTGRTLSLAKVRKTGLEARLAYIERYLLRIVSRPAWCADVTQDLSGDVGTIEVPGEPAGGINIRPGYDGAAVYDQARDGMLQLPIASTPSGAFYNLAMLPGWQKWKPTHRYGVITALEISPSEGGADYCDVELDVAVSSGQALEINQTETLEHVPIQYMCCNGPAFEIGDRVIVEFTAQNWNDPIVIGFKENPKYCHPVAIYTVTLKDETGVQNLPVRVAMVWDPKNDALVYAPVDADDSIYLRWLARRSPLDEIIDITGAVCGNIEGPGCIPVNERNNWDPYRGRFSYSESSSRCEVLVPGQVDSCEWGYPYGIMPEVFSYHVRACNPGTSYDLVRIGSAELQIVPYRREVELDIINTYSGDYKSYTATTTYARTVSYDFPFGGKVFVEESLSTTTGGLGLPMVESFSGRICAPEISLNQVSGDFAVAASSRCVAMCCWIVYVQTHYLAYGPMENPPFGLSEIQPRVVYCQAQAVYDRGGVEDVNIAAVGANEALSAQLQAAIDLAYQLNEIPDNDIRPTAVDITIMK